MTNQQLVDSLRDSKLKLVVAESLTGGALASTIVEVPGASDVFLGSVVVYATELKASLLGVDESLLERVGAVDAEVATQMALGARRLAASGISVASDSILAVATTGVAGPTEQDGHPVGQVFISVVLGQRHQVFEHRFSGDRGQIRTQAVAAALQHCLEAIS